MPKRNGFFMVSNRIFDFGLTPRTFAVYCCLLRHKEPDDQRLLAIEGNHRKNVPMHTADSGQGAP